MPTHIRPPTHTSTHTYARKQEREGKCKYGTASARKNPFWAPWATRPCDNDNACDSFGWHRW